MDKQIFTLIARIDEKVKLWKDMAQVKGEILCKGKGNSVCKVRIVSYNSKTHSLECHFESQEKLKDKEEYLGHFFIGGEKYYFQSSAHIYLGKMMISLPAELYHLQRRQNYRVPIPDGYPAHFNIIKVNENSLKITGALADLSSQGCKVIYRMESPLMKMGDAVVGLLSIEKRPALELNGFVRHIKYDEGNKFIQTFGIEFTPLAPAVENKLFAITMEIHKQLFRRF